MYDLDTLEKQIQLNGNNKYSVIYGIVHFGFTDVMTSGITDKNV